MRLVSWNVRSLRDDRSLVATVLRDLKPDVVCLQEAPRFLRSRTRLAALARDAGLLFVCGGRAAAGPALLVAMRVDVERSTELRFPKQPGLHRRGVAVAEVQVGGLRVVLSSVHLGLDADERVRHARSVRDLVDAWSVPHVVVAGDLNEPPGAPAWEQLSDGLVDVAVAGALAFPTYPAAAPRSRIDAIFASPGLAAQPMDPRRPGLSAATDHLPVAADLGG